MEPFRALVEPLVEYDRERRSNLVKTLKAYFDSGTNASEAADRLFLHRNSVLYRLARVEKLTGLHLKDPEQGWPRCTEIRSGFRSDLLL